MSITPELVFSWVGISAIVLCVAIGAILIMGGFGKFLYRSTVSVTFVLALALSFGTGIILMSSPKWTQLALKFKEVEVTIAELKQQNGELRSKLVFAEAKNNLRNYISVSNVKVWEPAQTDILATSLTAALQEADPNVAPSMRAVTQAVGLLARQGYAAYRMADQKPSAAGEGDQFLLEGINPEGWATLEAQGIIEPKPQK